jgi:hypothetical protein
MIAEGKAADEVTITHNGALVWRAGAAIRRPDAAGSRILLQAVPDSSGLH